MFKIILATALCLLPLLFNPTTAELPVFNCVTGPFGTCAFLNINTTKENPNFQPYNEDPSYIYKVYILNTSRLEVLTSDICDYFPRLGELVILNVPNLQNFTADSVSACRDLSWFSLYGSSVTEIPLDLFKANPEMRHVIFKDVPIQAIQPGQFHGIDLSNLILVGTNITEFPVDSIKPEDSPYLKYFVTSSSNLVDFDLELLLSRFELLRQIGYDDNDIRCSRVEVMNGLMKARNVTFATERSLKPRVGPTETRDGVICVP